MHASLAAAVANPRSMQGFDILMVELGFDCEPFSALVEYSEYKYDAPMAP